LQDSLITSFNITILKKKEEEENKYINIGKNKNKYFFIKILILLENKILLFQFRNSSLQRRYE